MGKIDYLIGNEKSPHTETFIGSTDKPNSVIDF